MPIKTISFKKRFKRDIKKLDPQKRAELREALQALKEDPIPAGLHFHPLKGYKNTYTFHATTASTHKVSCSLSDNGEHAELRRYGPHDKIDDNPPVECKTNVSQLTYTQCVYYYLSEPASRWTGMGSAAIGETGTQVPVELSGQPFQAVAQNPNDCVCQVYNRHLWFQVAVWGIAFLSTLWCVIDDATPRDERRFFVLLTLVLAVMTALPAYLLWR